jgi:hypothetical protein
MPARLTSSVKETVVDSRWEPNMHHHHPYDKDYEDFSDNYSTMSTLTQSSTQSTLTTATVLTSISRVSAISTPRTWTLGTQKTSSKPQNPLTQSQSSNKSQVSASVVLRPQSASRARTPSTNSTRPLSARTANVSSSVDSIPVSVQKPSPPEDDQMSSRSSSRSDGSLEGATSGSDDEVVIFEMEEKQKAPPSIKRLDIESFSDTSSTKDHHVTSYSNILSRVSRKDINTVTTKPFRAHSPIKLVTAPPSLVENKPAPVISTHQKRPQSASTRQNRATPPVSIQTARNHRSSSPMGQSKDRPHSASKNVGPSKSQPPRGRS